MRRIKRILAVMGIVLLVLMYLVTLLSAVFDRGSSMALFRASVICTVLVPILLWGYLVIYRIAKGKDDKELKDTLQRMEDEKNSMDT